MGRILGTAVAIAGLLAWSSLASAASYSFDVSGSGASVMASAFATVPCAGPTPGNCVTTPFSAGSSIQLDITSGYVTITSGTLEIDAQWNTGGALISTDVTGSLSGGLGVLVGNDILWVAPAAYTFTGTLTCTGPDCGAFGLVSGAANPISVLDTLGNTSPVNPIVLGIWDLDTGLASILGSARAVTQISNAPPYNRAAWLLFGPTDLVPIDEHPPLAEPGSAVLVILGIGALGLRVSRT